MPFPIQGCSASLTSGSLVYTGVYGVAPQHFGYFFILNIGVMMVATFLSGRFVSRLGTERILRMGLWVQLIAGLWLAACAFFQWGLGLLP